MIEYEMEFWLSSACLADNDITYTFNAVIMNLNNYTIILKVNVTLYIYIKSSIIVL